MTLGYTFIALVAVQAAHSVEEYIGRLYDVLPPARFVSALISTDLRSGFVIFNVVLVLFGVWCFSRDRGPRDRATLDGGIK